MSKIRSKDTKPELLLRSALHRRGYRFRIHRKDLPGKPDIVLPKFKTVIFVHGCFWHLHQDCIDGRIPKTQSEKWRKKLEGNVERDKLHEKKLIEMGWHVLTIWECEVEKEIDSVLERIDSQLKHQGQE